MAQVLTNMRPDDLLNAAAYLSSLQP